MGMRGSMQYTALIIPSSPVAQIVGSWALGTMTHIQGPRSTYRYMGNWAAGVLLLHARPGIVTVVSDGKVVWAEYSVFGQDPDTGSVRDTVVGIEQLLCFWVSAPGILIWLACL